MSDPRGAPMIFVIGPSTFLRALVSGTAAIALENLALRHQLLVLKRSVGRPRLCHDEIASDRSRKAGGT